MISANLFLALPFLTGQYSTNVNSDDATGVASGINVGDVANTVSGNILNLDITWNIYTRENKETPFTNYWDVNVTKPLKMILHGFLQNAANSEYLQQKDLYLNKEDCTVIIIDWSKYNNEYISAVFFTKVIGDRIGSELYHLYYKTNFTNIHLLGHSLGAHMSGFIGKVIKRQSKGDFKIKRITGWDAALPLFNPTLPDLRLAKDDAEMVDVIHTDSYRIGIGEPIGKVDFYPNGGTAPQPGCENVLANILEILQGRLIGLFCSHSKSREYFRRSITNSSIYATKCNSWGAYLTGGCSSNTKIVFGENVPMNAEGSYYFSIK